MGEREQRADDAVELPRARCIGGHAGRFASFRKRAYKTEVWLATPTSLQSEFSMLVRPLMTAPVMYLTCAPLSEAGINRSCHVYVSMDIRSIHRVAEIHDACAHAVIAEG